MKTPTHCFICERPVEEWKRPYVELGVDGEGYPAWAHFICWSNSFSPLVKTDAQSVNR